MPITDEPLVVVRHLKHDQPSFWASTAGLENLATQSLGKAVSALQTAFNILDGAEIVAFEELDAKLTDITALVTGIQGLLPKKAEERLKQAA